MNVLSTLELTKASEKPNKTSVGKKCTCTIVHVPSGDRTYSPHYQLTVSRIQLLYLHSECYCSGWSGDIHCNIHTRMFQVNCGTSVSILRSLWNTRSYLKTDKPRSHLVQSKGIDLHTKERRLMPLLRERQDNPQSATM